MKKDIDLLMDDAPDPFTGHGMLHEEVAKDGILDEIIWAVEDKLHKKAMWCLAEEVGKTSDVKHLHAFWKGIMSLLDLKADNQTFRMGCGIINQLKDTKKLWQ